MAAEQKLKYGQVKCAVATASLELGIDVGTVDLVVQLGSPRSIATLLQRVGRSGHTLGGTPKGRLFALTRDQLIECAALVRGVRRGNLDEICVRDAPLDILAQQIVAACAAEGIAESELAALIRGATPYANIDDERLEQILVMLSEGVSDRRGRVGAYLHRDRVGGMLRARRAARLAAITSGGNTSVRVEASCPSLTNMPPASSSASWMRSSVGSRATSSFLRPRRPKPWRLAMWSSRRARPWSPYPRAVRCRCRLVRSGHLHSWVYIPGSSARIAEAAPPDARDDLGRAANTRSDSHVLQCRSGLRRSPPRTTCITSQRHRKEVPFGNR